eukprot:764808-Hanusia_phi.AAC.1
MNSWYDITGLGVKELRADEEGIRKSIEHIHSLLKAEIEAGTPRFGCSSLLGVCLIPLLIPLPPPPSPAPTTLST